MSDKGKAVVAFLKKRWLPVTAVAVGVLSMPGLIYAASTWGASIREEAGKKANDSLAKVNAGKSITYSVPELPGRPKVEFPHAPSDLVKREFEGRRTEQKKELESIGATATEFNRRGRDLAKQPVSALFPDPSPIEAQVKTREFVRGHRALNEALLKDVRAGKPRSAADVAQRLDERRSDLMRQFGPATPPPSGGQAEPLPDDIKAKINTDLETARRQLYEADAARILFYADIDNMGIGAPANADRPTIKECWDLMWDFWVREDILRAVERANAAAKDLGVGASIVKRVERIDIKPPTYTSLLAPASGGAGGPADTAPETPGAEFKPIPEYSITGRLSGPGSGNTFYDVRTAEISVIVAWSGLKKFMDALAATNMMTVLELKIENVDPIAELRQGFFYGSDYVVRAKLRVESLWLRQWTKPWMPKDVRTTLRIPDDPPPAADPSAPGAPAAAPGAPPAPPPG